MRLVACLGCQRHVRSSEPRCPFCDADVVVPAEPLRRPIGRLGRAALFAFGATLGATSIGCGESTTPLYGAPPEDGGSMSDAGTDSGGPAPAYGAVPADAGPMGDDAGGGVPLYGGAPED